MSLALSRDYSSLLDRELIRDLRIFEPHQFERLDLFRNGDKVCLRCAITGRVKKAKGEEVVRQLFIQKLLRDYNYRIGQIDVEVPVPMGASLLRKADIVVYHDSTKRTPWFIVETKRPHRDHGIEQLQSYMNAMGTQFGVWTDGTTMEYYIRKGVNSFSPAYRIPNSDENPDEFTGEPLEEEVPPNTEISVPATVDDIQNYEEMGIYDFDELEDRIAQCFFMGWGSKKTAGYLNIDVSKVRNVYSILTNGINQGIESQGWSKKELRAFFLRKQLEYLRDSGMIRLEEMKNHTGSHKDYCKYQDFVLKTLVVLGTLEGLIVKKADVKVQSSNTPTPGFPSEEDLDTPIDMSIRDQVMSTGKDILDRLI